MALTLRGTDQLLCPVLKSRAGEVYWAMYRWTPAGALERLAEEQVGSLEALARMIQGPMVLFGEGWQAHREALLAILGSRAADVREPAPAVTAVSAVSVGLAGMDQLARGLVAGPDLSPRYVQRTEAEIARERGGAAARPPGAS